MKDNIEFKCEKCGVTFEVYKFNLKLNKCNECSSNAENYKRSNE